MYHLFASIDKPSLRTTVQICESQLSYSTDFEACSSHLASMVQKTPEVKGVDAPTTAADVDVVKLRTRTVLTKAIPYLSTCELLIECSMSNRSLGFDTITSKKMPNGTTSWLSREVGPNLQPSRHNVLHLLWTIITTLLRTSWSRTRD